VRCLLAVIALGAVVAVVPALPYAWASLSARAAVTGSAPNGYVTVAGCTHAFLPADWHCQGSYAYADPMANGDSVTANVTLANDPRDHNRGNQVSAVLQPGSRRAYLWGGVYTARLVLLALGLVVCLLGSAALLAWRRPRLLFMVPILAVGIACLLPTLVDTWSAPSAAASSQPVSRPQPPPATGSLPPSPSPGQTP
jgi:hypothetical protein